MTKPIKSPKDHSEYSLNPAHSCSSSCSSACSPRINASNRSTKDPATGNRGGDESLIRFPNCKRTASVVSPSEEKRTAPDTACVAFILPNRNEKLAPFPAYRVTVDSLESVIGIDLFPHLPNGTERRIESDRNSQWTGLHP